LGGMCSLLPDLDIVQIWTKRNWAVPSFVRRRQALPCGGAAGACHDVYVDKSKAKPALSPVSPDPGRPAGHGLARAGLFDSANLKCGPKGSDSIGLPIGGAVMLKSRNDVMYARCVTYERKRHL
jgi:hypothetical protein